MKLKQAMKVEVTNLILDDFLSQVSPEIAATFTQQQITAISKIYQNREWCEHTIDLRLSVLTKPISFYLVILAGEERRSQQRLQYQRSLYPVWTFGNVCFFSIFSLIFLTCSIYTLSLVKSVIPNNPNSYFPTSIPGIENQEQCEKFNRIWKDDQCWDYQHSPDF